MAAVERATSSPGSSDPRLQVAVARARDEVAAAWRLIGESSLRSRASVSARVPGTRYLVTTPPDAAASTTPEQLLLCDLEGTVTWDLALLERVAVPAAHLHAGLHRELGVGAVVLVGVPTPDTAAAPLPQTDQLLPRLPSPQATLQVDGWILAVGPDPASTVQAALATPTHFPAPAGKDLSGREHGGTGRGSTPSDGAQPGHARSDKDQTGKVRP